MSPATSSDTAILERTFLKMEPLVQEMGAIIRDTFKADGLPYSADIAHKALCDGSSRISECCAELLVLVLFTEDGGRDDPEASLSLTQSFLAGLLRRCFEEFGPVDDAVLAATVEKGRAILDARYRALAGATMPEGRA